MQLDDLVAVKLLEKTHSTSNVRESLDGRRVGGHEHSHLVVTPNRDGLVTDDTERDEAHDSADVQQLRRSDRRSEDQASGEWSLTPVCHRASVAENGSTVNNKEDCPRNPLRH